MKPLTNKELDDLQDRYWGDLSPDGLGATVEDVINELRDTREKLKREKRDYARESAYLLDRVLELREALEGAVGAARAGEKLSVDRIGELLSCRKPPKDRDPKARAWVLDQIRRFDERREGLMDDLGLILGVLKRQGGFQIVEPGEEPISRERPEHLRACGTKHRGCDPKCMARLFDERDTLEDKLREAGEVFLRLRECLEEP